jgi:hypothetical protein
MAPVTVITATPDTPVQAKGDVITLSEFDETSVVQTRFRAVWALGSLVPAFERDVAVTGRTSSTATSTPWPNSSESTCCACCVPPTSVLTPRILGTSRVRSFCLYP